MAEVVQSNIEDTLPEVYELQQLGIFSQDEAKSILRDRTKFEYMMRRRISKKQDVLRFIDFELKLEKLKQHRISQMGSQDISEGVHYKGLQRIHFLFQKCLKKNKSDTSLWFRYIKYCKEIKSHRSLGLAFSQGLKHNPTCVKMWIMSAKNEMEVNKNASSSRLIFLQGLKFNPDSAHLWTEYFRLEVLYAEKLQKRQQLMSSNDKTYNIRETPNDNFLNYKTAKIVLKNALDRMEFSIKNISDFLSIAKKAENGFVLIQYILESALRKYPENSELWVKMAGFAIEKDTGSAQEILTIALKTLPTMGCLKNVIEFVLKYKEKFDDFKSYVLQFCKDIGRISIKETHFAIELAQILLDNSFANIGNEIITLAQEKFPNNKSLWMFRINVLSVNPIVDLEKAIKELPSDIDIWMKYLAVLSSIDIEKCKDKWKFLIQENFQESIILVHYFEFIYSTSGFDELCKSFHSLVNIKTLPQSAYKSFIKFQILNNCYFESICATFDLLTEKYNTSCNWQCYLEYCQEHCPEKLMSVSWKKDRSI